MTEYFEDMWLALESELSNYDDSYSPNEYASHPPEGGNTVDNAESNIEPKTYENLLEIRQAPNPTHEKLRSPNRKERIEAIKELYNKVPTILNVGISLTRIKKVAGSLHQLGLVHEGNELMAKIASPELKAEDSINRLMKISKRLAQQGLVKQAVELEKVIDNQAKKHIDLSDIVKYLD